MGSDEKPIIAWMCSNQIIQSKFVYISAIKAWTSKASEGEFFQK